MIFSPPELRLLHIVQVPSGLFIVLALATMSSVTGLHLLSQSMLNVSCQKQKQCSSFPADSLTESPMEFVGQPRPCRACNLLEVPGPSSLDVDDDEGEVVIGIRPKSSPLPRRKSSVSDEDSEPEPPPCGSRRVSFADAKGLSLVQVKEFETWDVPNLPKYDFSKGDGKDTHECFLSLFNFSPLSPEELFTKVRDQKVVLETIELLPGTTTLKGVARVLNVSFSKAVYVRTTLDTWSSHFDLLAEYIPGSSDGLMERFSFKLTLVPPFEEQGTRVDFCLRYETPVGTFWANNNNGNYVLFCHQGTKERKEKPQKENSNKKSCLKPVSLENNSAVEASSEENISTDVSKQGEEVNTVKDKQISDPQSGTSGEDEQKLRAENRRNSSRRSRRKAARMARLRELFAQRDGGAERDESPPGAKLAAEEEKHSHMQSLSEARSESGFQFVNESQKARSEPLVDVLNDTSQAHYYTSNSKPEKSESIHLAESLTQGESATDIPDKQVHSNEEPASAELPNINTCVSEADGENLKQGLICEGTSDGESVVSTTGSESLVSQSSNFTFGTVVAPLYHQVLGGGGNQSCHRSEKTESTVATDVQENVTETQESNQECLISPHIEEEDETSLSATESEILDPADAAIPSNQRCTNPDEDGSILNMDLVNAAAPKESIYPQGETQEDNMTHDLQSQAIAETAQCSLTKTNLDSALEARLMTSVETSLLSHGSSLSRSERVSDETDQCTSSSGVDETHTDNETGKTATLSTTRAISEEEKLLEALNDFNPKPSDISGAKETVNSYISCCEIVDENNFTTAETSLKTQGETDDVEKRNESRTYSREDETKLSADVTEPVTKADHAHGDMFVQLKDKNIIVSEEEEHSEMEAAASTREGFSFAEAAELKSWEMTGMVVEKEKNNPTDEEQSKVISSKAAEKERVLEDTGIDTASENMDAQERENEETGEEVTEERATGDEENEAEDAGVSDNKQSIAEKEIRDYVAGKDADDEKELENVQAESDVENRGEKHFAQIQEVKEEKEVEEEMDLKSEDKARAEREDQVGPREESVEDKDWDYTEEMQVEAAEEETDDANSEGRTSEVTEDEVVCFEEKQDITQNESEGGLSALVNNLMGKDEENAGGGQRAHVPAEKHFYKEEENVTHDRSEAESEPAAVEGCLCVLADEPESDQTSHGGASAESDSDDDEVELHMRCLRAVHTGTQAQRDKSKDAGLAISKRPSVMPSMPSISESLDEEQHLSCLPDNNDDVEEADFQHTAAREHNNSHTSWWKDSFSCGSISKTLLYVTLLVSFLVVAYHYDFLACFVLYLVSLVWLCCQGETRPVKNNN